MSKLTQASIVVRRRLEASRIESDLVLFDDRVGKYFATGPVGADIWDLTAEATTVAAIVSHLLDQYDINSDTCEAEVVRFLDELIGRGLVQVL